MSYMNDERELPPATRLICSLVLAAAVPSLALLGLLIGLSRDSSDTILREIMMPLLALFVGQALLLAIPITLSRWRRMRNPLRETIIIGALTAPGPLGYVTLLFALPSPLQAILLWLLVALLGAIGGAIFWALATNLGRMPVAE